MRIRYYWINLDSAKSRYNNMISEFEKNGITNHTRISAYPSIGETKRLKENACCRSHLQAVMHFLLNSNDPYALICEDDLTFELKQYWKKSVEEVVNEAPSDWGIIQLATILQRIEEKTGKLDTYFKWSDQRSSSCLAWVIHRKCAVDLLNTYLSHKNIYEFATPDCWSSGVYIRVDKNTKYTSYTYKYPMFIYPDDNDSQLDNSLSLHVACKREVIQFLKKSLVKQIPTPVLTQQAEHNINSKILTSIPPKSGFGANYLWNLCFLIHCRTTGSIYYHTSIENSIILNICSSKKQDCSLKQEYKQIEYKLDEKKKLDEFTGFALQNNLKDINVKNIEKDMTNKFKSFQKEDVSSKILTEIRTLYYQTPKPKPIDCDIAVHIRRGDVTTTQNYQRFCPISYYENMLDSIIETHFKNKSPKIVIFSLGEETDFIELKKYNNIIFMLETNLMEAFHTMVTAPHFLMGYSALSCAAALLSANTVYYTRSETWIKQCIPRLNHWIDYTQIDMMKKEPTTNEIQTTNEIVYTYINHRLGFGAQYIGCICCYIYCRNNNHLYYHTDFNAIDKRMNPELNNISNKAYTNELNNLTGLTECNIDIDISNHEVVINSWQLSLGKSDYKEEYLDDLKKIYYSTPKPQPIKCDIAIHIRRGDVGEEKSKPRFQTIAYYKKILESIVKELPHNNPKIIVFSQGTVSDFMELHSFENIEFFLNTDINEAFHSMVCAPIFIMGYSALSCCAALLSDNKIYYTRSRVWKTQCICCLDKWINISD